MTSAVNRAGIALRRLSLALAWATAVAFGALHALIVWQLCRPHVRAEFG